MGPSCFVILLDLGSYIYSADTKCKSQWQVHELSFIYERNVDILIMLIADAILNNIFSGLVKEEFTFPAIRINPILF